MSDYEVLQELDFSNLEVREVPVKGPDGKSYTLREATGGTATQHRDATMAAAKFGPDGRVIGFQNLAGIEAKFVSNCLWDEDGKNPNIALVKSWPARVQKVLFEKAKELSDMDDAPEVGKALSKALQRPDSPVSVETFQSWLSDLEADGELAEGEVKTLKRIIQDDNEEGN